jgi:hypothetical protein
MANCYIIIKDAETGEQMVDGDIKAVSAAAAAYGITLHELLVMIATGDLCAAMITAPSVGAPNVTTSISRPGIAPEA